MGGIGKTTLADVVYGEICQNFESHLFLRNVSEKIKNVGNESLRNELFSKLLNEKGICINSPSIGHPYQERLNNKKVLVVLDDVSNPDQIEFMGVKHFGPESKIIVTSRDRQVLKNGRANHIYEVKKLNENDSLQLFSTLAFNLLNPAADFQGLSCKFVGYAQGNPLALKVLGSKLYTKSRKEWESEVDSLRQYAEPKMSHILKSSLDGLRELEKNIFLDIACFNLKEKKWIL
ncbi:disease resistance protein RUN1-like [Gossypium hirsutum]|uniref:Disease resistance protein RUN1-like n=1 Tax=Gossypium hirsutum TaxID=3635 RepID=A0A1U8M821_GOSHI|nr:disease resistance protein RUN1-like [Gossypium hirsutum]